MQHITVVANVGSSPNQTLEREVWQFWFDERHGALVLDEYRHETRRSLRHKTWEPQAAYSRLNHRSQRHGLAAQANPPLPEQVKREALAAFMERITVRI
jgi:hypothetical protein